MDGDTKWIISFVDMIVRWILEKKHHFNIIATEF
jgi:hypothetical protein